MPPPTRKRPGTWPHANLRRIIDLMCEPHRTRILDTRLWPAGYLPGNHGPAGNNSCHRCAAAGARAGDGQYRSLPHLDGKQYTELVATHEAGHAVAYLTAGIHVAYAEMSPSPDHPGSGAHIAVKLRRDQFGSADHLTGLWAGQAAELYWLDRRGLLDDATLIDVVCRSESDATLIAGTAQPAYVVRWARTYADGLVARRRDAVAAIVRELLRRGRLTGDELADLVVGR